MAAHGQLDFDFLTGGHCPPLQITKQDRGNCLSFAVIVAILPRIIL
jgi:hypothetical protein